MDEVIEFIKRRFPTDSNWLSGNCYYFAKILQERFGVNYIMTWLMVIFCLCLMVGTMIGQACGGESAIWMISPDQLVML